MHRQIFFNGKILTQDKSNPQATAFVIENDKFISVGSDSQILSHQNENTILVNLNQQIVLPGFNDAHIHIWKVGNLLTYMLDLRGVQSAEEMLDKINDYAKKHPELSWIQARGFNEANFPDQRIPTKTDLDKIIPDRPVCITRTCAHQIIVNTPALKSAGITKNTQAPAGGEIKYLPNGEVSGHFTETAIGLILSKIPKYSPSELRRMVLAAQDEFIKAGITSATDPAVEKDLLDVYKQMDRDGELIIRINAIPIRVPDGMNKIYPNPEFYYSSHLNINTVKYFADGGLSGKTAALKMQYKNTNQYGVLRIQKEIFKKLAAESQEAGFRIATHAIGDAAIEMIISVYNEISISNKNKINHRIEHLGLPSEQDLRLMKELNISAVMQPVFIYELGKNFTQYLPDHYLENLYPVRSVLDHGINLALSTDAPVVKDFSPRTNILSALQRKTNSGETISSSQKIKMEEALFAYTMGSAIANGASDSLGSIATGKYADFNILQYSGDLENLEIAETYSGGMRIQINSK